MKILVTGGAGYIGSHTVKELIGEGFEPVILDNFSTGRQELVLAEDVVTADLRDRAAILEVFRSRDIRAVLHFASLIQVGESYRDPRKYYKHNLLTTLNLLDAMIEARVKAFVFSSSAAVYGEPVRIPIDEDHPQNPISPYGQTKQFVERMLLDFARAYDLNFISLRYFNAAGADPEGRLGELHNPESHLIPNILLSLLGKKKEFILYGTDFPTPDGTAIRDYIHVTDLAAAHVLALKKLLASPASDFINLGAGKGHSVLDVIRKAGEVTGRKLEYSIQPRRLGDSALLLASRDKAERVLNWKLHLSSLDSIIETAWNWHCGRASRGL